MTTKEFILEQLSATRNTKNWFVSFRDSVEGLSAEQAKWHDSSGNHSVWQIVNHLIFWNERLLARFSGGTPPAIEVENDGTFLGDLSGEAEWQVSVKKFDDILAEFETRLKAADNSFLMQKAIKGYDDTWYDLFAQMTIHIAYHIGQIVYLRKQQGSWSSEQGVK
jgi:uncharacterized damage-inducible protein DinB